MGFLIVGIAASAGGLEAFKRFLRNMPADSGVAIVLVPHLAPTHESLMVDLLARQAKMPVRQAENAMSIEPNFVYVIPPNKYLSIADRKLHLSEPADRHGVPTAIDFFLCSLATEQRERAIGIILSGTSNHGTIGLKAIKLAGGTVMVQDPDSAEFDQMPRNAIATGLVDFVLSPEQMPDALVKYVRHPHVHVPPEQARDEASSKEFDRILVALKSKTKCDFRGYRRKMLTRRVLRRMGLFQLERMSDYLELLRDNPDEIEKLYKDLLIGVTDFFRDSDAFEVLQKHVVPSLVSARSSVRVWVPACATGEEAYSIAMLFAEEFGAQSKPAEMQFFATDIDVRSLEIARQGIYSESSITSVSPERLRRFFTKIDSHHWQVNKPLRETITIAPQNLLSDAPFSKLDLISCRNLLIYLEPELQAKVIRLFHFALNEGGVLLLGPSESIGREMDLFEPVSKKWRVFRRTGLARRNPSEIPIMASDASLRFRLTPPESTPAPSIGFREVLQRLILDDFAPAAVLINRKHEIACVLGPLVNYLEFPPGEITKDLLAMARPGLRTKIRAAVTRALHTGETVSDHRARVKRGSSYVLCSITVKPVVEPKDAAGLLLVCFQDRQAEGRGDAKDPENRSVEDDATTLLAHLEHELKSTREDLQNTVDEYEGLTSELKTSNEEVMSMNEELQSANEELETSKEELQSLNEELGTVNVQLQEKVEELDRANSDLTNLIGSSDVATVFLDSGLRIQRFTPSVAKVLNLRPADLGRPIDDLAPKFDDDSLLDDCHEVLEKLSPIEKEVWTRSADARIAVRRVNEKEHQGPSRDSPRTAADFPPSQCFLRRILPYHSASGRVDGVVITLVNITQRVAADAEARRLATVLRDSNDAVTVQDLNGRIIAWNCGAERIYGYTEAEATQMNIRDSVPAHQRAGALAYVQLLSQEETSTSLEMQRLSKDGRVLDVELTVTAYRDERGQPVGVATTERDITHRKELQKQVLEISAAEQRRIGQELHDGTGQELTGLALIAGSLVELLNETPRRASGGSASWNLEEAELIQLRQMADRLSQRLVEANRHVQQLSHGIMPVQIEPEGLGAALHDLAQTTDTQRDVSCRFECPTPVAVANNTTATHLFRIAQEAVTNALRHSDADQIWISLRQLNDRIVLEVSDNGSGIDKSIVNHAGAQGAMPGFGLAIMNYRAGIIGGKLHIERRGEGGTSVTCIVPRR